MNRIYLDNHATTPVDPRVFSAMAPWFTEKFGNAASKTHAFGWEAEEACDIAREKIAYVIQANSSEIIFTSGATESINLAFRGLLKFKDKNKNHIVTLATEHKTVIDTCKELEKSGIKTTFLPVDKNGFPNLNNFKNAITEETFLVSILHANNEIGVIQNIVEIGDICRDKKVIFHVDAAQSFGKVPIDVDKMNIDLLSISAHKVYGPKGIGALYVRRRNPRIQLEPLITGGGHEKGLRSGTLPVPLIVGFGKASEITLKKMALETESCLQLRDLLLTGLLEGIEDLLVNGDMKSRLPGNLNVSIPYVNGEALIMRLAPISVSSGSACTSSVIEPSHVLKALGVSDELAYASIRFGIGRFNTSKDIESAIDLVCNSVKKLRNMSRRNFKHKSKKEKIEIYH